MSAESLLNGKVELNCGDCLDVLRSMPDCSIDSCVTDPPYALVSISKRFGKDNSAPCKEGKTGAYARASRGFMGKQWDNGERAFSEELWAEVLRVLKPGGHVLAFGGTRTVHRLVCAIEDAGFEIRDQVGWAFGSGFPKSHNAGNGWGTALKPAWEPICLARKPLIGTVAANLAAHGTGAINIDECRIHYASDGDRAAAAAAAQRLCQDDDARQRSAYRIDSGEHLKDSLQAWNEKSKLGRWPANLIHDGSEEVLQTFPDAPGQQRPLNGGEDSKAQIYGKYGPKLAHEPRADEGSAARFFYSAKADSDDRIGSKHPTVKPVDLMQYLVRLVTPKGGRVLDPFAGTGTTGEAAFREGMCAVLIEREEEYQNDIRRRMELALAGPDERARESIKARGLTEGAGPLFENSRGVS